MVNKTKSGTAIEMRYKTKVQLIIRLKSEQYHVNFTAALAQAMEFTAGEEVEWLLYDHQRLVLIRSDATMAKLKEKLKTKPT
ncbi:hypothetical protein [Cyclobacterium plantarum]|uniref:hypothetical protein n=1 Tax=Cyclobacterium plantarum TaxID=2716263 RepID=UPI003F7193FF